MNPRPLRPESADGGAVICSVLMFSAVLRDLRRLRLLCFDAVWCGLGWGVRGVVSWECPEIKNKNSGPAIKTSMIYEIVNFLRTRTLPYRRPRA